MRPLDDLAGLGTLLATGPPVGLPVGIWSRYVAGSAPQPAFEHTRPERCAQDLLRRAGVHFRTHAKELPGNPDIVVDAPKVAIFVHGCFWHNHGCDHASAPKPGSEHAESIRQKQIRDARNPGRLAELGWKTCIVWECELERTPDVAQGRMLAEIGSPAYSNEHNPGGTPDVSTVYKTPFTLWATFGILGLVVLFAGIVSTLRIGDLAGVEAKVATASERLEELRRDIKLASAAEADARQRLALANQELDPIKGRLDSLRSQEDALEKRAGGLNVKLGEAQAEVQGLQDRIESAKADLAEAQSLSTRASREAEEAKAQAERERRLLQEISAQRTDEEDALREVSRQLTRYRSDADSAFSELTSIREQLASARDRVSSLENQAESAEASIAEAESARRTLADLRDDLADASTTRDELNRDLETLRANAGQEDLVVTGLRATAAELRQAISTLRATILDREDEQRRLSASLITAREEAQRSTEERMRALQATRKTESDLQEAESALAEARRSRETVLMEVEELASERQRNREAVESLRAELEILTDSVAEARATSSRRELDQVMARQLEDLSTVFQQLLAGLRDAARVDPQGAPAPDSSDSTTPAPKATD